MHQLVFQHVLFQSFVLCLRVCVLDCVCILDHCALQTFAVALVESHQHAAAVVADVDDDDDDGDGDDGHHHHHYHYHQRGQGVHSFVKHVNVVVDGGDGDEECFHRETIERDDGDDDDLALERHHQHHHGGMRTHRN